MTVIASHISALEYWLAPDAGKPAATRAFETFEFPPYTVSEKRIRVELPAHALYSAPLHVLVGKPVHQRSELIVHHTRSAAFRSRPFFRIAEDAYVCSVELAFLQVAERMNTLELIRLGYELCGRYSLCAHEPAGFFPRDPLTTPRKLAAFAANESRAHGRKNALQALRYIQPNSASPAETRLAMSLMLPYRLGGFNLPRSALNEVVPLSRDERALAGRRFLACDLYWKSARLGVEYDSDSFHTGAAKIASDAQRRNALTAGGTTVIVITRAQYNNLVAFTETARAIARMLGTSIRPRCADFELRQHELRNVLYRDPEWVTRSAREPLDRALEARQGQNG